MTPAQIAAVRAIAGTVVEALKTAGAQGMPAGHLYAALMTAGCTLNQFENLMGALVKVGQVRKQGQLYFAV